MIKKLYIAWLFAPFIVFSQRDAMVFSTISKEDAAKMMEQVNHWYQTVNSFSVNVIHATYSGHNATLPYEKTKGYIKKQGANFHYYIMNVHTIQNKNYRITIDSTQKRILVGNPSNDFDKKNISVDQYIKLLDKSSAIKLAKHDNKKILRIEFPQKSQIAANEFVFDKDGLIKSITVFYSQEVKSKSGQMVKPKFSIAYEKYATGILFEKREMDDSHFFSETNGILNLNESYKGYQFIDQRVKNSNQ